jgi:hypothetical protein
MVRAFSKTEGGIGPSSGGILGVAKRPYLPGAPIFAGGTIKLISGYSGKAIQVANDTSGLTQDINFIGDTLDVASMYAFTGAGGGNITLIYDQTGHANHVTTSTISAANRPRIPPQSQTKNLISGNMTMRANWDYQQSTQSKPFKWAAGMSGNKQALSVFVGVRPQSSNYEGSYFDVGSNATPTTPVNFSLQTDSITAADADIHWGLGSQYGTIIDTGILPRVQPTVLGIVGSATATKIWRDGVAQSFAAPASGTVTAGVLMGSAYVTAYNQIGGDLLGAAVYGSAVSDTDAATISRALMPAQIRGSRLLAGEGDSIQQGIKAPYGQNLWLQGESGLAHPVDMYNNGLASQQVRFMLSRYATRTSLLYDATKAKNIYFLWGGTNDLVIANISSATLWTSYYQPLLQAAKATGFKVVCGTILPRADATTTQQNAILTFNSTYINGLAVSGGYCDAVADFASDPVMGLQATTANTAYYWTDGVHPVGGGYSLLVQYFTAAVNSLL